MILIIMRKIITLVSVQDECAALTLAC